MIFLYWSVIRSKMATCPNLPFDETQWIIRIRRILEEEIELCDDQPISIFHVLKPLLRTKPDAYVPQLVALGPYHHCRHELRDMEMYKLSAAKRAQSHLPGTNLQQLVDVFAASEHRIRAHYHRHLNLSSDTLAWMMAIDVSFLVEFLQTFSKANSGQRTLQRIPSRMSHLVDPSRRTSSHSMLLRDVVMLENQIPLFLLVMAIEMRCSSSSSSSSGRTAQRVVSSMLSGFLQEVSSLKGISSPCRNDGDDVTRHAHLLDFLYSNMVPSCVEESVEDAGDGSHNHSNHGHRRRAALNSVAGSIFKRGLKLASLLTDFMVRILLRFVTSLPCLAMLRQPIEQLASRQTQRASEPKGGADVAHQSKNASPLLEEIAVPSVAELAYAGVSFSPTSGGLSTIEFCERTATLHLPVVSVDVTTEAVLRNLVAYEASAGSRPALVLARYVELMNGIVDTEEDARVLRECGVILNHLKSDQEVAELWNGMTRSVRLTRVPALDRVIDELNTHYSSCWKVRVRAFVKARVVGSRDLPACVVLIFLFVFLALQALCLSRGCLVSWYGMARRKDG